jgi:hypothetical protein
MGLEDVIHALIDAANLDPERKAELHDEVTPAAGSESATAATPDQPPSPPEDGGENQ